MADLSLEWGDDLILTPGGDLALVDGSEMVRQHILRRLLTALGSYIWHPEYGAGLPQRIGKVATASSIQALVRANIALEGTVAKIPVPVVTVAEDETVDGLFNITIKYADATTGAPTSLSLQFQNQR